MKSQFLPGWSQHIEDSLTCLTCHLKVQTPYMLDNGRPHMAGRMLKILEKVEVAQFECPTNFLRITPSKTASSSMLATTGNKVARRKGNYFKSAEGTLGDILREKYAIEPGKVITTFKSVTKSDNKFFELHSTPAPPLLNTPSFRGNTLGWACWQGRGFGGCVAQ